jgi:YggT family protein
MAARPCLRGAAFRGYTWPTQHLERRPMFLLRLIDFLGYLVQLYVYIIIASVILSWLMAFGVVNPYNPTVRAIWQGLNAVTEPLLRPIRNVLPNLGAIDLSPVVLLLLCFFVQSVVLGTLRDLVATAG